MTINQSFTHPTLTIKEQISLLKQRGLCIPDEESASRYLAYIGYYRLSGYFPPYMNAARTFIPSTDFNSILDTYLFDRKLRLIVFDAIERIEVALRSCMTRVLGEAYGPHWFMLPEMFEGESAFLQIQKIIREATLEANPTKQDGFIKEYYSAYSTPDYPPSWMTLEVLSMGAVSFLFKLLRIDLQKRIAKHFAVNAYFLSSWMHALTYTRNICAHHARLWNRTFTIRPKEDKRLSVPMTPLEKFYAQAVVMEILLKAIAPDSHWETRLNALFKDHPVINTASMGFPVGWVGLMRGKAPSGIANLRQPQVFYNNKSFLCPCAPTLPCKFSFALSLASSSAGLRRRWG